MTNYRYYKNGRKVKFASEAEREQARQQNLKKGNAKYLQSDKGRYAYMCKHAKRSGRELGLSLHEYIALTAQPCYYCGNKLPHTGGLDRIDNTKGYTSENVLPCCTACNRIRGDNLTVPEMKAVADLLKRMRGQV